jgi:hypothetical protein
MVATHALAITTQPGEWFVNLTLVFAAGLPVVATVGAVWAIASPVLRRLAYWQATALLMLVAAVVSGLWCRWLEVPAWGTIRQQWNKCRIWADPCQC